MEQGSEEKEKRLPQPSFEETQGLIASEKDKGKRKELFRQRRELLEEATPYTRLVDTKLAELKNELEEIQALSDRYELTYTNLDEYSKKVHELGLPGDLDEPPRYQGVNAFLLRRGKDYLLDTLDYDMDIYAYPEGKKRILDTGQRVEISKPPGFILDRDKFADALRSVSTRRTENIRELMKKGITYAGSEDPGKFGAQEVVGCNEPNDWPKVIDTKGFAPRSDTTIDQAYKYAKLILEMSDYRLREFIEDIHFSIYTTPSGERKFFVDYNGRHRVTTLMALADMGCEVNFSQMKVSILK